MSNWYWRRTTIARLKKLRRGTLVVGNKELTREQAIGEVRRKTEVGEILVKATKLYLSRKEQGLVV